MANRFDQISLRYWDTHKKKVGSSKSYSCICNGYVYGDDMQCTNIEFVHLKSNEETVFHGKNGGLKWAYFELVETSCNESAITLSNFINNSAEKFRIYSESQVAAFSKKQINSTRIKDDSSKISVNGQTYYVANNLKVCEYFNSAAMNIASSELNNWYIRIYFDDSVVKSMSDRDESEELDAVLSSYTLTVESAPACSTAAISHVNKPSIVNIDFQKLNLAKKKIGDLGETIVIDYEIQRLTNAGRPDLAASIEHTAVVMGDGLGFDISSYLEDGTPLYIEVKSTKQNKAAEFYLSRKEKEVAEQMANDGKQYRVYRVHNLNVHTGIGNLIIYAPPFDDSQFDMEPENWLVKIK